MYFPSPGDYIDIHIHDGKPSEGVFILQSLMAHEDKNVQDIPGVAWTYGIHPWYLDERNYAQQIISVGNKAGNSNIIAIGEAGLDKLHGPSPELQRKVFEEQIIISETNMKPLVIHCVRAWDELISVFKKLKPKMPWIVHGFRGSPELASQLISKGLYLSIWFDFVLRSQSTPLLRSLPKDKLFLETDGADIDIRDIYKKVSGDLDMPVEDLKGIILNNYKTFFNIKHTTL
jgi:TatD DNase family protein